MILGTTLAWTPCLADHAYGAIAHEAVLTIQNLSHCDETHHERRPGCPGRLDDV